MVDRPERRLRATPRPPTGSLNVSGGKTLATKVADPGYAVVGALWDAATAAAANPPTRTYSYDQLGLDIPFDADLWNGAVVAPNGIIYGVPDQSDHFIIIDPYDNTAHPAGTAHLENFGVDLLTHNVPYGPGVLTPSGLLYFMSAANLDWLIIDPDGTDTPWGTAVRDALGNTPGDSFGRRATVCTPEGVIYGAGGDPVSTFRVADLNDTTGSPYGTAYDTTLGLDFNEFAEGWRGAVIAPNGRIYCAPSTGDVVLIIDPKDKTAGDHGTAHVEDYGLNLAGGRWQGIALGADGRLYCAPWSGNFVLVIDPDGTDTEWGSAELTDFGFEGGLGAGGASAKWDSCGTGPDGWVYCMNRTSSVVLAIDTLTRTAYYEPAAGWRTARNQTTIQALTGTIFGLPNDGDACVVIETTAPPLPADVVLSPALNKY